VAGQLTNLEACKLFGVLQYLKFGLTNNFEGISMWNARRLINLPIVSLALVVSGCASEPTVTKTEEKILSGDQMLRDSQGIAQLGTRWQEGKQMVDRGQEMQREGQAKIDQGRTMIEEGQKIMRESEEGYKTIKK
jgi:hypothetical protein